MGLSFARAAAEIGELPLEFARPCLEGVVPLVSELVDSWRERGGFSVGDGLVQGGGFWDWLRVKHGGWSRGRRRQICAVVVEQNSLCFVLDR